LNAKDLDKLLEQTISSDASDLHLSVGKPPVIRTAGSLKPMDEPVLSPSDTEAVVSAISDSNHRSQLETSGSTDFGFTFAGGARFRVSAFKQKGAYSLVLRRIPSKILSLNEIGLPESVRALLTRPRGLILVTGPTGSGKSTTLASMINEINANRSVHIITIEDPIEYYHEHNRSLVTQREIGEDVSGFADALRSALRQDPDVLLVGEMRDLETMEAAITAAETGHLVFATLHTTGAARTVDRIIDVFPSSRQDQVRTQLSSTLLAVLSQLLIPTKDGSGIAAAFEIMVTTPSIQNLIRENKTYRIDSDIQTGSKFGMKSLDAWLYDLIEADKIMAKDAVARARDPEELSVKIASYQRRTGRF